MKNKLLSLILVPVLCVSIIGCGEKAKSTNVNTTAQTPVATYPAVTGIHHVEFDVKDYGTIKVELDADNAPITVSNFLGLVNKGFYNGLTFHRIINGFVIQGGDPLGNGTGGSDQTIKGEFSANGVQNSISHVRGTISMARSQANNSASSQFFICQADTTNLDGMYAGFGHVTEGMDIVDKIAKDAINQDKNGTVPKEKQPVITSIKQID